MTTRRDFLQRAGLAAGGLLVTPWTVRCAGVPVVDVADPEADRVVLGLHATSDLDTPDDAVHRTLERVDMTWLRPGDSVFLKVACNSGNRHPAVTSPTAVRAMCRALLERGAGRVLVGDQSGVMSVRLASDERRFRATRQLMEGNGLLSAIEEGGGEPHFFDDQGFAEGYVQATLPDTASAWRRPPFIARVTTEVDHIVYLPRLSSHVLTGYTHGHKLAVGFMRDDTRHHMHNESGDIFEKYTELSYCEEIRSRLRLVVTLAEEILVDSGPDSGGIATADPLVVLVSSHLANHDAVSVAMLTWAQRELPWARWTGGVPYGPQAVAGNLTLLGLVEPTTGIPWTSEDAGLGGVYVPHDYGAGIDSDRALTRAYELLGGAPRHIRIELTGAPPSTSLRAHLERYLPVELSTD